MYTLLTGAIKNAGDFLIAERAKILLTAYSKEKEFLEFHRWEPLDDKLAEINKTKGVILCGGPGYRRDFYPETFRLTKNVSDIKIPIIPYGLGWCGQPMYDPDKFSFSNSSKFLLRHINQTCEVTSCRDNITKEILNRYGFKNVVMTGCPTWYDLGSIGKKFEQPKEIRRVAVSMAQRSAFFEQNVELLEKVRELLQPSYPGLELWAVFHRGVAEDEFTAREEAKGLQGLRERAGSLDYTVHDISYGASGMELYRDCDLHVGFRVHAHIFFLSIREPTFLLHVDGRGRALSQTLGLPDVPLLSKSAASLGLSRIKNALPSRLVHALGEIGIARRVNEMGAPLNQGAITTIVKDIETELMNGLPRFQKVDATLDNYFKEMVRFLKTLP
jgi:hypothetical protein